MRITAGQFKGRELTSPKSASTHPMGERERLALFNSLVSLLADQSDFDPTHPLQGLNILDAYAGTGALGLEALSRGAKSATFIENHPAATQALRQNIQNLSPTPNSTSTTIIKSPVAHTNLAPHSFQLIFADPPYDYLSPTSKHHSTTEDELSHLLSSLAPSGYFVLSHPANFNHKQFAESNKLKQINTKKYAAANLSIFTINPL